MEKSNLKENRRNFLKTMIPVSGMFCMGCPTLLHANTSMVEQDEEFSEKILQELTLTYEQYFRNRYDYFIRLMKKFSQYMEKETVLSMIKKAEDENNQSKKPNLEAKSVKDFANLILGNETFKICQDLATVELTDKVFEVKVTNCLWAKTFREKDAGDIGYATMCHGDFTGAAAYHPKLKLERTKTLMEGHDCCNLRFTWSG